jgi:tetratricopeptide (TPR) repeat protein
VNEINLLQYAIKLHQDGQNQEARKIYLQILGNTPNHENVLNNLGVLEASIGNYFLACDYFTRVTTLFPKNLSAWSKLAVSADLGNHVDIAKKAYNKALKIDPKNIAVLLHFGSFLKRLSINGAAKEIYKRVLAEDPQNLEALNNLGNILLSIGDFNNALSLFNKVIALYGGNEITYNNIATIYSEIESYEQAINYYELALRINPKHILSLNGKGNVFRELGQLDKAIECFQMAVDIESSSLISHSNLAGAYIASLRSEDEKLLQAKRSLSTHLANQKDAGTNSVAFFAMKHHMEQAIFLTKKGIFLPGQDQFILTANQLLDSHNPKDHIINVDQDSNDAMRDYLGSHYEYEIPDNIFYGLNPNNDWLAIQEQYTSSNEVLYIDNFLSADALEALYTYSLLSKVWLREYPKCYLGAFGYQGFISRLHLKIADELSSYMPKVFQDYKLSHLWAFKYDTKLGSGINVHADPAKVNVNFWLTPDEFNLDKDRGGLIIYNKKPKKDWNFYTYNNDPKKIYDYLSEDGANRIVVPYRRNRCVLFNSVLFHETDEINFKDEYEGRRINMTYLFGQK